MPDGCRAERARADVALDQLGVGGEVGVRERLDLGRADLRPRAASCRRRGRRARRSPAARRVPSGCRSLTTTFFSVSAAVHSPVGAAQVVAGVEQVDERGDRRRVRRVVDVRGRQAVDRRARRAAPAPARPRRWRRSRTSCSARTCPRRRRAGRGTPRSPSRPSPPTSPTRSRTAARAGRTSRCRRRGGAA